MKAVIVSLGLFASTVSGITFGVATFAAKVLLILSLFGWATKAEFAPTAYDHLGQAVLWMVFSGLAWIAFAVVANVAAQEWN